MAKFENPLKSASDEELESALGSMEAGALETKAAEDKESAARRQKAEEIEHRHRVMESVKRAKAFEERKQMAMAEDSSKVDEIRRALGIAGIQEKTGTRRVTITGEDARNLQTHGRILETQRKGFGTDRRELGGTASTPEEITTGRKSETSFRNVSGAGETPETGPAMFRLEDLQKQPPKKDTDHPSTAA